MLDKNKLQKMEANMLMSIVNMKIRNEFKTFTEFCDYYAIDQQQLAHRLWQAGYQLNNQNQQFLRH